ncbi:MAG: hypothetical protein PVF87_01890 [Acidimicrobiia bacterium]|jgi:hypothetical protein
MDREYARAYMNERLEAAERRRQIAAIDGDHRPHPLARLTGWIAAIPGWPRPVWPALAVSPLECLEPDCCLA